MRALVAPLDVLSLDRCASLAPLDALSPERCESPARLMPEVRAR